MSSRTVRQLQSEDRAHLLRTNGLGEGMVRLIEAAGYTSLQSMIRAGLERVLDDVCAQGGTRAYLNRRRALARALQAARSTEH
jgi:hypothetical protein